LLLLFSSSSSSFSSLFCFSCFHVLMNTYHLKLNGDFFN
jgi:hypothetical protein